MNFNKMLIQNIVNKRSVEPSSSHRHPLTDDESEDTGTCDSPTSSPSPSHVNCQHDLDGLTSPQQSTPPLLGRNYKSSDPTFSLIKDLNNLRDIFRANSKAVLATHTTSTGGHHSRPCRHHQRRGNNGGGVSLPSIPDLVKSRASEVGKDLEMDERLTKNLEKVTVEVRIVFLKIGEIDTLKEVFHAEAFIQAKWKEPRLNGRLIEDMNRLDLDKCWNPLLHIDNILTDTKDQVILTAELNLLGEACLTERRRIKGVFLETLELNDFPLDVQDLTITMTSERPTTEVDIVADSKEPSGINMQTFVDQQEWRLHEHVEVTRLSVTPDYTSSRKCHPCFSVTCRAARRPGYFYWNVFLIMFFITGLSFATFAVPHYRPENRLQLSFTLFLTSVAFKFVVNQSLPKISYLTYMDKYVLMSLAILCLVSVWHAVITLIPNGLPDSSHEDEEHPQIVSYSQPTIIGGKRQIEISQTQEGPNGPTQLAKKLTRTLNQAETAQYEFALRVERDVFISFCAIYILAHIIFIFWLYFDASKRRREMYEKDRLYKQEKLCLAV